ncbi:MAG: 2-dehydropantoate 2-reductase, partial [Candidatus Omnitrophica bacterium]|nr:2-dehydropantoate 2-reductase [Candidatus Omnitrophota bacterium]
MKVVIVGPGALGCLFAATLAKKKLAEVWLLDKDPRRAKKIRESGITVEGLNGDYKIKVDITARAQDIKSGDLFIICVKSFDTEAAVKGIEPLLHADSSVLTLQNGLGNLELISEIVGKEKAVGGVTAHGVTLLAEGHIRHAGTGETVLGRIDGTMTVAMRQLREILNKAGFSTRLSKDLQGVIWSKLVINVGINAVTALTRLPNGCLVEAAGTRNIVSQAVAEAVRVAKRKRIKLLYDDPIQKVESVCSATADNLS